MVQGAAPAGSAGWSAGSTGGGTVKWTAWKAFGELRAGCTPRGRATRRARASPGSARGGRRASGVWLRVRDRAMPGSAPSLVGARTTRWRSRSPGARGRSSAGCGWCIRSEGSRRAGRGRRRRRRSCRRPGGLVAAASVAGDPSAGAVRDRGAALGRAADLAGAAFSTAEGVPDLRGGRASGRSADRSTLPGRSALPCPLDRPDRVALTARVPRSLGTTTVLNRESVDAASPPIDQVRAGHPRRRRQPHSRNPEQETARTNTRLVARPKEQADRRATNISALFEQRPNFHGKLLELGDIKKLLSGQRRQPVERHAGGGSRDFNAAYH